MKSRAETEEENQQEETLKWEVTHVERRWRVKPKISKELLEQRN